MSATVFAQEYTTVTDQIYEVLAFDDKLNAYLLAGAEHMIFLNGDSIRQYDDVQRVYAPGRIMGTEITDLVVERKGRSYLINENAELFPAAGLPFTADDFNHAPSTLKRNGNTLVFTTEEGVYVVNAATGTKTYVIDEGDPLLDNERQLWIRTYDDEFFFFHPTRQVILRFPLEDFGPSTRSHDSLIVTSKYDGDFDGYRGVFDFDQRPVVGHDRGFTEYYINSDIIILNGHSESLLLRGPSDTTLLKGVKEVQTTSHPEILIATEVNSQKYFIDRYGQRRDQQIFHSIESSILRKGVLAKDKTQAYLFAPGGELLLAGKYEDINYLCPDRFIVTKNHRHALVNKEGELLIPYELKNITNPNDRLFGATKAPLILSRPHPDTSIVYNLSGEKVITWNPNVETRLVDEKTFRWSYGLKSLAALPDEQAVQLNATNAWRISRKVNDQKQYRLIRRNGNPITEWYDHIYSTTTTGLYVVGSEREKYRLIRVMPDYSLDFKE